MGTQPSESNLPNEGNGVQDVAATIKPEEFTFTFLNKLFWDRQVRRDGTLVVGGVTVTKHLRRYTSNSGKSSEWEVSFTWVDVAGKPQKVIRESSYSSNRRNDPERNWGLHE
jgi:hypothetical protein